MTYCWEQHVIRGGVEKKMVKLQTKQKSGTHLVSIPKRYVKALGWSDSEELALCPGNDGVLRLVPLFRKTV